MEQANWQRNRGKKLKFSIGILVLVLFGFVAGVGLAEPIRDHIRETTQRKPFNDGKTTQPNTEIEDSQGFRSPIAPEENLTSSPIRVRPTDQEGSEAGQQTPASTNMDSDPGTSGLPSGSNHTERPDYNGVTSFRDFVCPEPGNPAFYALAVQPNTARGRARNAPIDDHRIQIPNERPNEPQGVLVQGDGGNRLTENGRNFYDVLYVVASSLKSDRGLMIFTVMILLTLLALAFLEYLVAMASIGMLG